MIGYAYRVCEDQYLGVVIRGEGLIQVPDQRYLLADECLHLEVDRNDLNLPNIANRVLVRSAGWVPADVDGMGEEQYENGQLLVLVGRFPKVGRSVMRLSNELPRHAHNMGFVVQARSNARNRVLCHGLRGANGPGNEQDWDESKGAHGCGAA